MGDEGQREEREHACAPVALFGFNRPDNLRRVFEQVRRARPRELFLILDAPRDGRPDDLPKNEACRRVFDAVDWPCEVRRNYAATNMGCRRRMASGISWVFEQVEEAILLEDDCVPSDSFFPFCTDLLARYRHDTRLGMVAGHIAHLQPIVKEASYYFDRFPTIWGWATWRRAWALYDGEMGEWPRLRSDPFLSTVFQDKRLARRIARFFEEVYAGQANTWATIWWYSLLRQNMLCAHPCVNLVSNVGAFGAHNHGASLWHNLPYGSLRFPLEHPREVLPDFDEEQRMCALYAEDSALNRAVYKAAQFGRRLKGKGE